MTCPTVTCKAEAPGWTGVGGMAVFVWPLNCLHFTLFSALFGVLNLAREGRQTLINNASYR